MIGFNRLTRFAELWLQVRSVIRRLWGLGLGAVFGDCMAPVLTDDEEWSEIVMPSAVGLACRTLNHDQWVEGG